MFILVVLLAAVGLTGCVDHTRTYNIIGLPGGDEILDSLKIALPLILVGSLIAYTFSWRKKSDSESNKILTWIGYSGTIIILIGFLFLIPLWAWFEYIIVSLIKAWMTILVVAFLGYAVYYKLIGKK
jgi:hypothetical protein